jgi:hypothetical protein
MNQVKWFEILLIDSRASLKPGLRSHSEKKVKKESQTIEVGRHNTFKKETGMWSKI